MKPKLFLLTCTFCLAGALTTLAQSDFEVPKNVELKVAADYDKYDQDITAAAGWLETTDLNKETAKRKKVNAFIIEWMAGSPTVNIEINTEIMDLTKDNVELLGIYMASYARHFLENKDVANKYTATKAAIISIINVYNKDIGIIQNKKIEKLISLNNKNKLDNYIKEKF